MLGCLKRVVDLDPQLTNGAFQLGMTEKKLHRPIVVPDAEPINTLFRNSVEAIHQLSPLDAVGRSGPVAQIL